MAEPLGTAVSMKGPKRRAQLLRDRYQEVVAMHRQARQAEARPVIVIAARDAPPAPVEPAPGTDDGEATLFWLPYDEAQAWLADRVAFDRIAEPADDAMDVVVLAGAGASVMRLTARG